MYSSDEILLTLLRSVMPFHFTYGAIMGYFIGKAFMMGEKKHHLIGIIIPVLLHTLFDSTLTAAAQEGIYILLTMVSMLLNLAVTIYVILKIRRLSKNV